METIPSKTRLHIPIPNSRPGDQPNFSNIEVPKAGTSPRPDPMVKAQEITELASSLIRVLNHKHERTEWFNNHTH